MGDLGRFLRKGDLAQLSHAQGACVFFLKKRGGHLLGITIGYIVRCRQDSLSA